MPTARLLAGDKVVQDRRSQVAQGRVVAVVTSLPGGHKALTEKESGTVSGIGLALETTSSIDALLNHTVGMLGVDGLKCLAPGVTNSRVLLAC
jgi:hypothetical protein